MAGASVDPEGLLDPNRRQCHQNPNMVPNSKGEAAMIVKATTGYTLKDAFYSDARTDAPLLVYPNKEALMKAQPGWEKFGIVEVVTCSARVIRNSVG